MRPSVLIEDGEKGVALGAADVAETALVEIAWTVAVGRRSPIAVL